MSFGIPVRNGLGLGLLASTTLSTFNSGFSPLSLFALGEQGAWYDPSDLATMFTDTAGTTPATAGDAVARINDKSGNNANATQATTAARPILQQDADGKYYLQNDEVDDALTVTFPNLGSDCTVGYVTASEVFLFESQTISGAYTLPATDLYNIVIIDRALTLSEKINLIRYLASKVDGVNYGGEIDRLTLIAINAVDVFVYDTSKDSDGGAWRNNTSSTSWYNETLNTATRGSRRQFPAVAVIVAEAAKVTIYDGDDPSLPMWMVFNASYVSIMGAAAGGQAVLALNGWLAIGSVLYDVKVIDFIADRGARAGTSTLFGPYLGNIAARNDNSNWGTGASFLTNGPIISRTVNDVAMTILPGAPTDPATGLPVPTIAVATAGGVSVITDSGAVYDSSKTTAATDAAIDGERLRIAFTDSDVLAYDIATIAADGFTGDIYDPATTPALLGTTTSLAQAASGSTLGMTLLAEDEATPANGMVSRVASTYNTGWMNGDIKGAFLSDTDTASLVGPTTDSDRSINNVALNVNGTITRTAVASGADLVAYSGFSAANYLEQPYNSALDFGTGDFCVMGWVKTSAIDDDFILNRSNGVNSNANWGISFNDVNNGFLRFTAFNPSGSGLVILRGTSNAQLGNWVFFAVTRRDGVVSIFKDGVFEASASINYDLSSPLADHFVIIGIDSSKTAGLALPGSLALLRISATAPSAEQIAKIYNDELPLFQVNARATLYGASDAVTALAHDPDTDLLHVGTSAGRSIFRGLERLSNTTTSVATAISASGGLVISK